MESMSDIVDLNCELVFRKAVTGNVKGMRTLFPVLGNHEVIEPSISKAYEKLKLLNVHIEEDMDNFLLNTVISSRFITKKDEETQKEIIVTFQDVSQRIDKVVDILTSLLITDQQTSKVMDIFLYKCSMLAKHLHILKNHLKSTFDKIPWTEMEFCILAYICTVIKKTSSDDIYNLVLDKERLLTHFANFKAALFKLKLDLDEKNIGRKLRLGNRNQMVESVKKYQPGFENLYEDYDLIRDVASLKRVDYYINVCRKLNFNDNNESDKLILERTLQVIGESLKSTPDSPNISTEVQEMLLKSAPKNLKEIITSLRDSLSHTDCLMQKAIIEHQNTGEYFKCIQKDLEKIYVEINNILFRRKLSAFAVFSRKVLKCDNLEDIRKLGKSAESVTFEDKAPPDLYLKDLDDVKILLDNLELEIEGITLEEKQLFSKVKQSIDSEKTKLNKSFEKYQNFADPINYCIYRMGKDDNIKFIQKMFSILLGLLSPLLVNERVEKIVYKLWEIRTSIQMRMGNDYPGRIEQIFNEIFDIIMLRFERIADIGKFKSKLEKADSIMLKQEEYIDSLISSVKTYLKWEYDKVLLEKAVENKKEIYKIRLRILSLLENQSSSPEDQKLIIELVRQLKTKKKIEDTILENYTKGNFDVCKNLISKIDDPCGLLLKEATDCDIFSHQKQERALKLFLASLKLKKFPIDEIVDNLSQEKRKHIAQFFKNRLSILKDIIPNEKGIEPLEAIRKLDENDRVRVLLEQVLLDLLNILENASLFIDDKLFLDDYPPLLIGKSLRNYLAHGNFLIDVLPYSPSKTIACNALKLFQEGETLLERDDILIGKKISCENFKSKYYMESYTLLSIQNVFYAMARKVDVSCMLEFTNYGVSIWGRDILGRDILHYAASKDNLDVFQYFLKKDMDIFKEDLYGTSRLDVAIECKSFKILRYLINEQNIDLTSSRTLFLATYHGIKEIVEKMLPFSDISMIKKAFCIAAENCHKDLVKIFLDKYSNESYLKNTDALHKACVNGCLDVVELLLSSAKFDVNKALKGGLTPLHFAVVNGDENIVKMLLKNGAKIEEEVEDKISQKDTKKVENIDDKMERFNQNIAAAKSAINLVGMLEIDYDKTEVASPIHLACIFGHENVLRILLRDHPKINSISRRKFKPVHIACICGEAGILEILLENGAHVDVETTDRYTPLHLASENGFDECVDILLKYKTDINKKTADGYTALHLACQYGHEKIVQKLLELSKNAPPNREDQEKLTHVIAKTGRTEFKSLFDRNICIDTISQDGFAPLHIAAQNGYKDMITLLIKRGANVNITDKDKNTPLHYAAHFGFYDIVKILIDYKADINFVNSINATPLIYAIERGFANIAELLINKGAKIDLVYRDTFSPLHLACKNGLHTTVDLLLEKGARVNVCDKTKVTPLHVACLYGHKHIVESLLKAKADINASTSFGYTPLYLSVKNGYSDVVEILLKHGADLTIPDESLITPLHQACNAGHKDIVEILLVNGANAFSLDAGGVTPLGKAAQGGFLDIVKILYDAGSDLNAKSENGETILHLAAESGSSDLVRFLIDNGAKPRAVDEESYTPLHVAAQNRHVELVQLFILTTIDINESSQDGVTPLHMAAEGGSVEVLDKLVSFGANVDKVESSGETALHIAVENGHRDAVVYLLGLVKNINLQNYQGHSVLHLAVINGHIDIVEILLLKGASIDIADVDGETPLHLACACEKENEKRSNYEKIVGLLLANGASNSLQNFAGETPLDKALKMGCEEIINLLLYNKDV